MKTVLPLLILTLGIAISPADVTKGEFGARREPAPSLKKPKSGESQPARKSYPFRGTIASVDNKAKSLILEGKKKNRVILITAATRFFKNGAKAGIEDAATGQYVTGTVQKNAAGLEEAITVRVGSKPPPAK